MAAASLDLLAGAGFRALPLKGAAVLELLYTSPAERPMADVDLFVIDALPPAVRLLEERGFTRGESADHATALQVPGGDDWLELHSAWASVPSLHPVDAEGVWQRRRAGTGRLPQVPSLEDLLLQAALHATFQHGLALRLVQYLDLVRLAAHEELDADRLAQRATGMNLGPVLALALAAAHEMAGDVPLRHRFPVPAHLQSWVVACREQPERVLRDSGLAIARLRLALARGRRLRLLRRTLVPAAAGPGALLGRAWRLARRTLR